MASGCGKENAPHERGIRRFPSGGRQRRQRQQRAIGGRWRHALPIPPGMLAGALVSAERRPINGQVSPASGRRSGSSLGSRERVGGGPRLLETALRRHHRDAGAASMSCTGRSASRSCVTQLQYAARRWWQAVPACSQSPPPAGTVGLGDFALTMRIGMATGVLRFGGRFRWYVVRTMTGRLVGIGPS
jgi:hypothetical protein